MSTISNGKYVEPRQTILVPWSSFWYAHLFVQVPFALGTFRAYRRPLGNNRPQSLSDSL
jgi:hypothetical protein